MLHFVREETKAISKSSASVYSAPIVLFLGLSLHTPSSSLHALVIEGLKVQRLVGVKGQQQQMKGNQGYKRLQVTLHVLSCTLHLTRLHCP